MAVPCNIHRLTMFMTFGYTWSNAWSITLYLQCLRILRGWRWGATLFELVVSGSTRMSCEWSMPNSKERYRGIAAARSFSPWPFGNETNEKDEMVWNGAVEGGILVLGCRQQWRGRRGSKLSHLVLYKPRPFLTALASPCNWATAERLEPGAEEAPLEVDSDASSQPWSSATRMRMN